MAAELTTEEIVTKLLSSEEILKPQKIDKYTSQSSNLGDFLSKFPVEQKNDDIELVADTKYTFIKKGGWKF